MKKNKSKLLLNEITNKSQKLKKTYNTVEEGSNVKENVFITNEEDIICLDIINDLNLIENIKEGEFISKEGKEEEDYIKEGKEEEDYIKEEEDYIKEKEEEDYIKEGKEEDYIKEKEEEDYIKEGKEEEDYIKEEEDYIKEKEEEDYIKEGKEEEDYIKEGKEEEDYIKEEEDCIKEGKEEVLINIKALKKRDFITNEDFQVMEELNLIDLNGNNFNLNENNLNLIKPETSQTFINSIKTEFLNNFKLKYKDLMNEEENYQ